MSWERVPDRVKDYRVQITEKGIGVIRILYFKRAHKPRTRLVFGMEREKIKTGHLKGVPWLNPFIYIDIEYAVNVLEAFKEAVLAAAKFDEKVAKLKVDEGSDEKEIDYDKLL